MKISEIVSKVEDALVMLDSGYAPEQWKHKKEIDSMRYAEAKSLKAKIDEAIDNDTIEYNLDDNEVFDMCELLCRLEAKIIDYDERQLY